MLKQYQVAVLGAGNMGTAVAQIIAKNCHHVNLWNYEKDAEPLKQIIKFGENKKYLPGVKLAKNIKPQPDLSLALKNVIAVFFVVPSFCMEAVVKRAAKYLEDTVVCVDMSKGIDEKSLGLITDVIKKNLPARLRRLVTTVSGPAIANDMARGGFTAMNIASKSNEAVKIVKKAMENDYLKLVPSDDMVGIEITGSFKNIYAIAMGLCDGLRLSMNTKAALLVFALKEVSGLVAKMGGRMETVYGLSGLGDLVGTGLCEKSRNRRFGELLARGYGREEALKKVGQVVEGIHAAKVLHLLAGKHHLASPFAEMVYQVSLGRLEAKTAMVKFLSIHA